MDENKTNTDTIIIASINNDTKEVRLVSIYRDTYLNIGEDRYSKANAAYPNGGMEWGDQYAEHESGSGYPAICHG